MASFYDWGKRVVTGAATMGLSEAKKSFYDDPANEQKAGYNATGDAAAKLGADQRDYETQQGKTALGYYSGPQAPTGPRPETGEGGKAGWLTQKGRDAFVTPGAQQAWDKQQAAYDAAKNGPISPDQALVNMTNNKPTQQQDFFNYMGDQAHKQTNQETLFAQRMGGNDPAALYEDQRATEGINKQLAARGRFNSGAGVRQISDYLANANAQRSHDLASLAGGADTSRLGRDTAYGTAARGASGEESDYYGNVMGASQGLAQAKADTFGHYSDRGSDQYSQGQMAQIEARLQAAGVDAATTKQFLSDLGGAGKAGIDLFKTAKGGK